MSPTLSVHDSWLRCGPFPLPLAPLHRQLYESMKLEATAQGLSTITTRQDGWLTFDVCLTPADTPAPSPAGA